MSALVLVAAGGLAREVIALEKSLGRAEELLLVDDDPARWGTLVDGVRVMGPVVAAAEDFDGEIVLCAGKGSVRRLIAHRLAAMGVTSARYGRIIHPSVEIPPGCTVGPGCILLSSVVMTAGVHLHRHVVAMPHVTLTHDDLVSDFATLCAGVTLGGGVRVGEGAYLGMSSSVRENVVVGPDAVLGMGSVLLHDLPAGETWAGVPARSLALSKQLVS